MFGENEVAPIEHEADGQRLRVKEIFGTIQGEGPFAGRPAIFIRMAGCNLRCHFCDTDFEDGDYLALNQIIRKVEAATDHCNTELIVITGGEPLIQNIVPLCVELTSVGFNVQIETAGTVWPERDPHSGSVRANGKLTALVIAGRVTLVCSPKTPKLHPKIIDLCDNFKYIIRAGEVDELTGLPNVSTQTIPTGAEQDQRSRPWYPKHGRLTTMTIWLQPCAEYHVAQVTNLKMPIADSKATRENIELCTRLAMRHGYRISLQQHKILGVD